ncbi:peptidase, partial [Colwellia sp. MB02u-18]|nr:peptidase [Colwellia sp. MB3u-45]MBA6265837.1 peptidase [Colwellia sp. MB3u-43]MBA6319587.1 peptidase [Colwellia sp. MB02u-19]MBA6322971.1 peptidase [Colwellia sp. MB02u-18]MBA6329587.1 peptidase [Colwellia sp. MB02u-12]MBA6343105.1 peptidase [Colwellia sp. MB02u-1]
MSTSDSASTSFITPEVTNNEVFTFTLTVTDNEGATKTDTITINVNNVNILPSANAGANQIVNENTEVSLLGAGSDSDGTIASYIWTQSSGTDVILSTSDSASTSFI